MREGPFQPLFSDFEKMSELEIHPNRNRLIRGPPEFCLGWMAMAQVKFKISHVNVTYASAHTFIDCSS